MWPKNKLEMRRFITSRIPHTLTLILCIVYTHKFDTLNPSRVHRKKGRPMERCVNLLFFWAFWGLVFGSQPPTGTGTEAGGGGMLTI